MFPLDEDQLFLGQIAEHWAAEFAPTYDRWFAQDRLWRAYWQGDLAAAADEDRPIPRRRFLEVIVRHGKDMPIVFVNDPSETKSEIDYDSMEPDEDGLYDIDTRLGLYVPADMAGWTDDILEAAYEVLAKTDVTLFDVGLSAGFAAQSVSRQSLERYCQRKGFELPQFWFKGARSRTRTKFTINAETDCRKWFKELIKSPKRASKTELLKMAQGLFPGLSKKSFNRVWSALAPRDWKRPGAPIKNPSPRSNS